MVRPEQAAKAANSAGGIDLFLRFQGKSPVVSRIAGSCRRFTLLNLARPMLLLSLVFCA